ncbi:MAG: hypothetical protein DRQ88_11700 [Epsilonproteobacteria bacterium]|nr:MAG: hypothetical protein DRQ88_11700 [Campylobacterota bacterium]
MKKITLILILLTSFNVYSKTKVCFTEGFINYEVGCIQNMESRCHKTKDSAGVKSYYCELDIIEEGELYCHTKKYSKTIELCAFYPLDEEEGLDYLCTNTSKNVIECSGM